MSKRTKQIIGISVFLSIILGFSVANVVVGDRAFSENENRTLVQLPKFTMEGLLEGDFTKKFEAYTTDQFPLRDGWVYLKANADYAVQKHETNGVYFADDHYLIQKFSEQELDRKRLEANEEHLSTFVNRCAESLGAEHVRAMIVPTAAYVLEDKLPSFAPTVNQNAILEDMAGRMPEGVFLNETQTLKAQNDRQIYYRNDHHWTTGAAYLAYRDWCESIGLEPWAEDDFKIETVSENFLGTTYSKGNYLGVKPDSIQIYQPKRDMGYTVDINQGKKQGDSLYNFEHLETKDKYAAFLDGNNAVTVIKTNADSDRKLLVLKDSYAHCFVPFAVNHFSEVDVLDLRHYAQKTPRAYIEENGITDVLVLYNLETFSADNNLGSLDL